jgi:hypothetical protein
LLGVAVKEALGSSIRQAAGDDRFIGLCAKLSSSAVDKVRARARFYTTAAQEWLRYYGLRGTEVLVACHLIALLTDLPPLWIFDCYTNRRGAIREATGTGMILQYPCNLLSWDHACVHDGTGTSALIGSQGRGLSG